MRPGRKGERLTLKQFRFAAEYVRNGANGVQAALAAYDTDSYNCANQIAMENLQKPTVIRAIYRHLDGFEEDGVDVVVHALEDLVHNAKPHIQFKAIKLVLRLWGYDVDAPL
jgi:phage terminase small subunit